MPLKVELKPHERVIIGESIITNGDHRSIFTISGEAPVLREKDILTSDQTYSPARRIYFVVQLMYIDNNTDKYLPNYNEYCADYVEAAPSAQPILAQMHAHIAENALYKALKDAKKLMEHERERIGHASGS